MRPCEAGRKGPRNRWGRGFSCFCAVSDSAQTEETVNVCPAEGREGEKRGREAERKEKWGGHEARLNDVSHGEVELGAALGKPLTRVQESPGNFTMMGPLTVLTFCPHKQTKNGGRNAAAPDGWASVREGKRLGVPNGETSIGLGAVLGGTTLEDRWHKKEVGLMGRP